MMADEYHVTFRVDQPVEMKTLAQVEAESWRKAERYRNKDHQVIDETGTPPGSTSLGTAAIMKTYGSAR
jgi:hypothetical protein